MIDNKVTLEVKFGHQYKSGFLPMFILDSDHQAMYRIQFQFLFGVASDLSIFRIIMVLQDCLAEELSKWLECALTKLSIDRDVKVLVVALVGKDAQSQSHSSVDCLNAMLNRQVFLSRWAIDRSTNKKAQVCFVYFKLL
jgi:hypothetical protein